MKTKRAKIFEAVRKYKLVLDYEKWCQYKTKKQFFRELLKVEIRIENVFKKPRLYIKKTSIAEITEKWKFRPILLVNQSDLYIRCTKDGTINWDTSNVYKSKELIERDNVKIL